MNINIKIQNKFCVCQLYHPTFIIIYPTIPVGPIAFLAAGGNNLQLYANKDKARDFLYITDALNAFLLAGQFAHSAGEKYYIIGSGERTNFKNIAEMLAKTANGRLGKCPEITESAAELPPVEMREFVGDSSAFKNLTGWTPGATLQTGIEKTVDYFIANLPIN